MAGFKPFLIANARTGLELDLDPWLLPPDAYTNLDNFYLDQGRITKRNGNTLLANIAASPVMGLFNYYNNTGIITLTGMTRQHFYTFDGSAWSLPTGAAGITFTGTDKQFFWASNWLNNLYMCNGVDALCTFNGTTLSTVAAAPVGSVFVTPYKSRLMLLNTVEGGLRYGQRARWSDISLPGTYPAQNYIDAPTQDVIMGACFLRDDLLVFFDYSVWVLRYTGDPAQPFIWIQLTDNDGTNSGNSIVGFQNETMFVGTTRILGTDGTQVYNLDDKIPRLMLSMRPDLLSYIYASSNDPLDQIWMAYPSTNSSGVNDKVLVLNYLDNSYSILSLAMHCFGYYDQQANNTWASANFPWSSDIRRWGDLPNRLGSQLFLGGTYDGDVVILNSGNDDLGTTITADLLTGKMNPFLKDGLQCNLGWVDILVDTQPNTSTALVELLADGQGQPYFSYPAVPLNDGKGNDKSWIRIPASCSANFHQLHISHSTPGTMVIHAVIPYAKPGGVIQ